MSNTPTARGYRYNPSMQVRVKRSRQVPVSKLVPDCPDCAARNGAVCMTAAGDRKATHCRSRRRLALRKLNAV